MSFLIKLKLTKRNTKSKQPIDFNLVDTNKIVMTDLSIIMMVWKTLLSTKKMILCITLP